MKRIAAAFVLGVGVGWTFGYWDALGWIRKGGGV